MIEQVCSLTIECQAYQFVPGTSISKEFVSKLWTILPRISVLLLWSGGHPSKDLRLRQVTLSFCLPARNLSQRIFEHVLPCRRISQPSLREAFPTLVIFLLLQQKFRDSKMSLLCIGNNFVRFAFTLSKSQVYMIKKWCWFVKINDFHKFLSHGSHISAYEQIDIPNSVLFAIQAPTGLPRTVFPGVLKQSQSALFCSITHITMCIFTCMMNIRYQSIQAFVTGFGPFCNRSCKFVH